MNKKIFAILLLCTLISVAIFSLNSSPVGARSIVVDGDPSDWAGIPPIATDPDDMPYDDVDLSEVYVTEDEDYLYIRIDVYGNISGTGGAYQVMMDLDPRNMTWDFQFGVFSGWGYGLKMPTYDLIPLNFSYSGSTVEMNVSLSDLDFPKAMDLMFFSSPYDSGYATSLYTVGSNIQSITVDGDPSDWTGGPFFMDDVGDAAAPGLDLQGCWVGDNGTDIFVMMNASGTLDPGANGQVFIDSYWGYDTKDTVIEFSTPLADIGNPSNVSISGGIRSLETYMDAGVATRARIDVVLDDTHYPVSIISNSSTASNFNFNKTEMQISFNVTSYYTDTTGYCNVTIPLSLMWCDQPEDWQVTVNGNPPIYFPTPTSNGTHLFLYFTYNHSTQEVRITSTYVVPEFPSAMILPLFVTLSVITAVFVKLKKKRQ